MLPSLSDYENLHLFQIIDVKTEKYNQKLANFYEEKQTFFKLSIILDIPIVLVLAIFGTLHFKTPWWSFFIYFFIVFIVSFFIICLPVYASLTKTIKEQEKNLFLEIDEHLSELANQNYFSKDSKAKRLLNQEFELVKVQPLSSKNINQILNNRNVSSQRIDFYDKKAKSIYKRKTIFFENRPLKPVALATVNLLGKDKSLSIQVKLPIEYELVHGLVSEQLVYFDKNNYYVNPIIYIDTQHFNELYQEN